MGEMKLTMAICAKSDQVFVSVIAKCASRTNMVDLETIRATAILASPAIPFKRMGAELAVGILVEPKPRLSLPN
jgi:hypothetical protein